MGVRSYPPRDESRARDMARIKSAGRFAFWLAIVPLLVMIWGAGYATGAFEAARSCLPYRSNEESTNAR